MKREGTPTADGGPPEGRTAETWFVYIVECSDGTLYTGITTNLERRVQEHNAGMGARYTRGRGPVALRYHEQQTDRSCASARECRIKALSRRLKQELIDQVAIN